MTESNDPLEHRRSINAQQREIYGESWSDRFGRLLVAYGIPQSKLASVIGISAPMISQLMSGQRVKISNPAVYGRIVRLEELLTSPAANMTDAGQRWRILDDVAASHPSLTTLSMPVGSSRSRAERRPGAEQHPWAQWHPEAEQRLVTASSTPDRAIAVRYLSTLADPAILQGVAAAAERLGGGPLAALLAEAGGSPRKA